MRKVLCAAALLLTSLAHGEELSSPSDRLSLRAAAAPTLHLFTSDQHCEGRFVELAANWGGDATSYELRYNGMVIATSTGPSTKVFRPGSSQFTLSLKGCKAGSCKTISRVVRTTNCSGSDPLSEQDL